MTEVIVPNRARFPEFVFDINKGWDIDPFGSKNWINYFMSLEWIMHKSFDEDNLRERVLDSFVVWTSKNKHDYYNGPLSDHCISKRLDTFTKLFSINNNNSSDFQRKILAETAKNIRFSLNDSIYRDNTNHGLQLSASVICAALKMEIVEEFWLIFSKHLEKINCQVDYLFCKDGFCLEHSTSYQEYNLCVLLQAIEKLEAYNQISEVLKLLNKMESIVRRGITALPWCYATNGEFFPIGDSFRHIPKNRIKTIADYANKLGICEFSLPPSKPIYGSKIFKDSGFSFIRGKIDSIDYAVIAVAACHSKIHNHQDDSSFTLSWGTSVVFDDLGYDGLSTDNSLIMQYRDSNSHNIYNIEDSTYSGFKERQKNSKIQFFHAHGSNWQLSMINGLFEQSCIHRDLRLDGNVLSVTDTPECGSVSGNQRFLLGPNVNLFVDDEQYKLATSEGFISISTTGAKLSLEKRIGVSTSSNKDAEFLIIHGKGEIKTRFSFKRSRETIT